MYENPRTTNRVIKKKLSIAGRPSKDGKYILD